MCSERWLRMMTGSWNPTTLRVRYGDRMVESFTMTSTGFRVWATDEMNPGQINEILDWVATCMNSMLTFSVLYPGANLDNVYCKRQKTYTSNSAIHKIAVTNNRSLKLKQCSELSIHSKQNPMVDCF